MDSVMVKQSSKGKSTSIRADEQTIAAVRLAANELAAATGMILLSDAQRLAALIEHWNRTKRDAYGVHSN